MIRKLNLQSFGVSLFVCVLLQATFLSSTAVAIGIPVEPAFGEPVIRLLLEQERYGEVRDIAEEQLRTTPSDGEMLAVLAYAQAGLGELNKARESALKAIELVPVERQDALRLLLADILLRSGDAAQAARVLEEVVARNPEDTRAIMSLGFLYSRSGNLPQAVNYFERALAVDPAQGNALRALLQTHLRQGDYPAVARVAKSIPNDSPSKGLGYYFEALALIRNEQPDYGAARDLLEKSLQVSEPSAQVLTTLGFVLLKEQRPEEAAGHLAEAAALAPDLFDAQRLLGIALVETGQARVAARHLEQALAIKESPELRRLLARIYFQEGRGEEGLAEVMTSLEDSDQLTDEQTALRGLYQYSSGDFEQSERDVRNALKKDPDAVHLRVLLIASLLQQQRFEGAAREARQALSTHPSQKVLLLNLLALAQLGSGAYEDAEAVLREALADDPGSRTTRVNLSTVFFRTNRFASAANELEQILKDDPNDVEAKVRLAKVFQASENFADAERVLLGADAQSPTSAALLTELVFLKMREDKFDEALGHARSMVAMYPRVFAGYLLQAQALASVGREVDAIDALDAGFAQAGETQGSLAVAASLSRVNGWHTRAVDYLRRHNAQFGLDDPSLRKLYATELIEIGETNEAREVIRGGLDATDPDALFLLAKSYLTDGDQVRAEEFIDAALEVGVAPEAIESQRAQLRVAVQIEELKEDLDDEPNDFRRYRALANAYELIGDLDAAIGVYRDGMGKAGKDLVFQTHIARLLLKQGFTQEAIDIANRVANDASASEDTRIHANAVLGMSWVRQGDKDKAEEALMRATVDGSQLASAHYELARIKAAKGDAPAAMRLLGSAIEIEPRATRYYLALATLHQRSGDYASSIAVYENGIASNPEGAVPLLNNVALVYLRQGATEKALDRAHAALELAPADANVLDTVGWVYLQSNAPEKGIPYLEQAVDGDPASSQYRYHLGMAYFRIGANERAKAELEKALDRQINAPWAPEIKRVLEVIREA